MAMAEVRKPGISNVLDCPPTHMLVNMALTIRRTWKSEILIPSSPKVCKRRPLWFPMLWGLYNHNQDSEIFSIIISINTKYEGERLLLPDVYNRQAPSACTVLQIVGWREVAQLHPAYKPTWRPIPHSVITLQIMAIFVRPLNACHKLTLENLHTKLF